MPATVQSARAERAFGQRPFRVHDHLLGGVGGSYEPAAFDIDELNAALELYDRHTRQRLR
jgi:hypothetical protein